MIDVGRQPLKLGVVSQAVAHICDIADLGEMTVAVAGLLTNLIPSDAVWRTRLDLARGDAEAVVVTDGAMASDGLLSQSLASVGAQHPAVLSYLSGPADPRPHGVSDVCSTRDWLASPAFSEAPSPSSGRHQLSMVTRLGPVFGEGWMLERHGRDFSAADVDTAYLLLPALVAMDRLLQERGRASSAPTMNPELSVREREVLAMVSDGLTAAAIGRRLGIAPGTVRKHLERVYRKLGLHDRLTAVTYARDVGLIPQTRQRTGGRTAVSSPVATGSGAASRPPSPQTCSSPSAEPADDAAA